MTLHFNIRIIRQGDRYGVHDALVHAETKPMVEFFDPRFPQTPHGQFVARYFVETILQAGDGALMLQGDVPAWTVSAPQMAAIRETLRGAR